MIAEEFNKKVGVSNKIIGLFFLLAQLAFAFFLLPTKFASLSQKLGVPDYVTVPNLLLLFIVFSISLSVYRGNKTVRIPLKIILAYLLLCITLSVGIFYSHNYEYGLSKTIEFITINTAACFAPFFLFHSIGSFEKFLRMFIFMGFILSVFIFASSPYSFQYYNSNSSYPEFQTTIGNNYLALQYIIGIGLLSMLYFFLFKQNTSFFRLSFFLILIGLFAAALLYAPGKNPIISLFVTIVIMTLLSIKFAYKKILIKKKILQYTVFMLLVGTVFMSTIGWMFILRLKAVLTPGYYGQVERIENTNIAIDMFLDNPFLGEGVGSFTEFAAELDGIERMKYPHNIILESASETGFTGTFLLLFLIISAFIKLYRLSNKYRNTQYYHIPNAVIAFFLFTFLASLTGGNINNPLLFAWIGVTFILENMITKNISNSENKLSLQ